MRIVELTQVTEDSIGKNLQFVKSQSSHDQLLCAWPRLLLCGIHIKNGVGVLDRFVLESIDLS